MKEKFEWTENDIEIKPLKKVEKKLKDLFTILKAYLTSKKGNQNE